MPSPMRFCWFTWRRPTSPFFGVVAAVVVLVEVVVVAVCAATFRPNARTLADRMAVNCLVFMAPPIRLPALSGPASSLLGGINTTHGTVFRERRKDFVTKGQA